MTYVHSMTCSFVLIFMTHPHANPLKECSLLTLGADLLFSVPLSFVYSDLLSAVRRQTARSLARALKKPCRKCAKLHHPSQLWHAPVHCACQRAIQFHLCVLKSRRLVGQHLALGLCVLTRAQLHRGDHAATLLTSAQGVNQRRIPQQQKSHRKCPVFWSKYHTLSPPVNSCIQFSFPLLIHLYPYSTHDGYFSSSEIQFLKFMYHYRLREFNAKLSAQPKVFMVPQAFHVTAMWPCHNCVDAGETEMHNNLSLISVFKWKFSHSFAADISHQHDISECVPLFILKVLLRDHQSLA